MEIKRIFATISTDDFYAFSKRCKKEDISIGQCFTRIVSAYANGANIIHVKDLKKDKHHKATGVNYAKEHKIK